MEYLTVAEARGQTGLRLVLTRGFPAPWGEAAKALFKLRNVEYVAVEQKTGRDNTELVAWTRHRNAPIALYRDEPPRVRWLELLDLAQRLGSGPSLMPEDRVDRIFMIGLINEIAGEGGLAWNARMLMLHAGAMARDFAPTDNPMFAQYQYDAKAVDASASKAQDFLNYLGEHLNAQQRRGSAYLVGSQLTAADVYWAYFSNMLQPLAEEFCPVPERLRKVWDVFGSSISGYDPILIAHRDRVLAEHLTLPLEF